MNIFVILKVLLHSTQGQMFPFTYLKNQKIEVVDENRHVAQAKFFE